MTKAIHTPSERITGIDILLTAFNPDVVLKQRLACGHKAITSALNRTVCPRCTEMLRRSLNGGAEDWDAFRHHGAKDTMIWKDDPMRVFHEPTNVMGEFIND